MKCSPSIHDCLLGVAPGSKRRCPAQLQAPAPAAVHVLNEKVAKRARTTAEHTRIPSGYPDRVLKSQHSIPQPSSTTAVDVCSPSQSVYRDEGLFLHIASYCDHRTTIRLCTVTKSYCKGRSHLIGKMLYRSDVAKVEPTGICGLHPSSNASLVLGHTYAHRANKPKVASKEHGDGSANATAGKKGGLCEEKPKPATAEDHGFLDGQKLIDALMLRVTFDLRFIPSPCPISHFGRNR